MKIIEEFKAFALKGNVIDLAVGVLIGASFGNIVKGFTDGIILPILGKVGGSTEVKGLVYGGLDFGLVINSIIGFLITAGILFFVFVKPMNKLLEMTKRKEAAAAPPEPLEDIRLLREIRDLLKKQA
ncbi:large conductance mechanosensitive channel protein MscL [soil metagenome]